MPRNEFTIRSNEDHMPEHTIDSLENAKAVQGFIKYLQCLSNELGLYFTEKAYDFGDGRWHLIIHKDDMVHISEKQIEIIKVKNYIRVDDVNEALAMLSGVAFTQGKQLVYSDKECKYLLRDKK